MSQTSNLLGEVWKEHPTYTTYKISSMGRVLGPSGKILKGSVARRYPRVTITHKGKQIYRNVHVLMGETFLGRTSEVVRHLDDNPTNNNLDNLALGTYQDNSDDAIRNGRQGIKDKCKRGHPREGNNLTNGLACRACAIARSKAKRECNEFDKVYADAVAIALLSGTWQSKGPRDMVREGRPMMKRKTDVYLESQG